jgi:hypothetical protein
VAGRKIYLFRDSSGNPGRLQTVGLNPSAVSPHWIPKATIIVAASPAIRILRERLFFAHSSKRSGCDPCFAGKRMHHPQEMDNDCFVVLLMNPKLHGKGHKAETSKRRTQRAFVRAKPDVVLFQEGFAYPETFVLDAAGTIASDAVVWQVDGQAGIMVHCDVGERDDFVCLTGEECTMFAKSSAGWHFEHCREYHLPIWKTIKNAFFSRICATLTNWKNGVIFVSFHNWYVGYSDVKKLKETYSLQIRSGKRKIGDNLSLGPIWAPWLLQKRHGF